MSDIHVPRTRNGGTFVDAKDVNLHSNDFDRSEKMKDLSENETSQISKYLALWKKALANTNSTTEKTDAADESRKDMSWESHYSSSRHHFPLKNYIIHAFPVLEKYLSSESSTYILECGCGTGSTMLPLMRHCTNEAATFVGFDISGNAIKYFSEHEIAGKYKEQSRLYLFEFDASITQSKAQSSENDESDAKRHRGEFQDDLLLSHIIGQQFPVLAGQKYDVVLLVFVLSALPSITLIFGALKQLRQVMKKDGLLLFRDYALPDHNFFRFTTKNNGDVDDLLFRKGDGTTQIFFEKDLLKELFNKCGFIECVEEELSLKYHCNRIENRKNGKRMDKIFLNGCFRLKQ